MIDRRRRHRLAVRAQRVADLQPPPVGWKRVDHFASDFAPCGCVTHAFQSVDATTVDWTVTGGRYQLRCAVCGHAWSRARPVATHDRPISAGLNIDASHPEERA